MIQQWRKWILWEAFTRTGIQVFQKLVGVVSTTIGHIFYAIILIGGIQILLGFILYGDVKKNIFVFNPNVLGAIGFGLFAAISNILSFYAFLNGGEILVITFIATLSIIPGALFDSLLFNQQFTIRQGIGILFAVTAGYYMLNAPSLHDFQEMPLWVWLSFGLMFSLAINQVITKKISSIDPYIKNFWGGLTTLIISSIGLAVFVVLKGPEIIPIKLTLLSLTIGIITVYLWFANVSAYKTGATLIALKKLIMNGSFLTLVAIIGVVFFNEPVSKYKILGFLLYFMALCFMDTQVWNFFQNKFIPQADREK